MHLIPESADYRTFVLSAQLEHANGDINCENHAWLTAGLAAELAHGQVFAVLQCEGRYQGADERSIAVIAHREWIDTAIRLGKHYGQESILFINVHGEGILKFMDGRPAEPIGAYQAVSHGTSDDFTEVLGTGHCFTFV